MISFALLCDAAIGNVQEKAIKQYGATNAEIVYYSYSIGFIYLFFIMLISGNLHSGFAFCRKVSIFLTYNISALKYLLQVMKFWVSYSVARFDCNIPQNHLISSVRIVRSFSDFFIQV